ncbi:SDE2 [Bugula neritina]|uniref:SDE2 n=1 Tax=Bugula neritina TaxID=10212 RepID=A0A7J7JQZ2_BUGNE|nr:SDE2 [Bugula neritina]
MEYSLKFDYQNINYHSRTFESFTCADILNYYGYHYQTQVLDDIYLLCNGRKVGKDASIEPNKVYRVCHRLRGGKGGFGSMLRTIGAQIEKTTNREAMRDLSGRRMRDINNEKKLAEWVAGASDREKQREERRKDRMERRRAEAEGRMHRFADNQYMEQKEQVASNLDDALTQGIKRAAKGGDSSAPTSKKSKAPASVGSWAGVGLDLDELSSSDDEVSIGLAAQVRAEVSDSADSSETGSGEARNENMESKETGSGKTEDTPEQLSSDTNDSEDKSTSSGTQLSGLASSAGGEEPPHSESNSGTSQQSAQASSRTETSNTESESNDEPIDLELHTSAKQLEGYGLEHLKQDLMRRGLKCGGSLEQRALRLFSVKGLAPSEIDSSLFAKKRK